MTSLKKFEKIQYTIKTHHYMTSHDFRNFIRSLIVRQRTKQQKFKDYNYRVKVLPQSAWVAVGLYKLVIVICNLICKKLQFSIIPSSHFSPANDGKHEQQNSPLASPTHVPPFLQLIPVHDSAENIRFSQNIPKYKSQNQITGRKQRSIDVFLFMQHT